MKDKIKNYNVVLVSQSPRRRELLKGLEIDFTSTSVDTDESYPSTMQGAEIPIYIATQKADAYLPLMSENTLAITADTVVLIDNQILGKPKNREEAISMLQHLSGNTHQVITGVCIQTKQKRQVFSATSEVTFATLTLEEIEHYVDFYKPFDKAGSYGVQEWIGYIGIEKIVGSYFNVMGLPVQKLYKKLISF
ncbi:MAG: Maf family nucleotide pyrophosphatase [Paludibacteraceae bacterium]|nr:Maf family nucleotide pyrophosphatase [Paludibacteraceae bacterium]